jgi:hypothetical protein
MALRSTVVKSEVGIEAATVAPQQAGEKGNGFRRSIKDSMFHPQGRKAPLDTQEMGFLVFQDYWLECFCGFDDFDPVAPVDKFVRLF